MEDNTEYANVIYSKTKGTSKKTNNSKSKAKATVIKSNDIVKINDNGVVDLTTIDTELLSKLEAKADSITVDNLLELGSKSQATLSNMSDDMLKNIRSSDINVIGDTLVDMTNEFKKLDVNKLKPMNKFQRLVYSLPLLKNIKYSISSMLTKFDDINDNLNNIVNTLKQAQIDAIKDNAAINIKDEMLKSNIIELEEELIVAQIKINQLKGEIDYINNHPDEFDQYELQEKTNFLTNLERHAADLNITRVLMVQSIQSNIIIKHNNDVMVQKVNSAINNTLPIWKATMTDAVVLHRQQLGIEKLESFAEHTNELLRKKSEMLKSNSIAIAKANERGVVDFDTLKNTHNMMIETIKEIKKIEEEGKQLRLKNNDDVTKLLQDIKNTIDTTNNLLNK